MDQSAAELVSGTVCAGAVAARGAGAAARGAGVELLARKPPAGTARLLLAPYGVLRVRVEPAVRCLVLVGAWAAAWSVCTDCSALLAWSTIAGGGE